MYHFTTRFLNCPSRTARRLAGTIGPAGKSAQKRGKTEEERAKIHVNRIELVGEVTMAPTKLKNDKEREFINMTVGTVNKLDEDKYHSDTHIVEMFAEYGPVDQMMEKCKLGRLVRVTGHMHYLARQVGVESVVLADKIELQDEEKDFHETK